MKRVQLVLALIALACSAAGETSAPPATASSPFPVTGMSMIQLSSFISEIQPQIPVGPKIINVRIKNESTVIITTGKITGPLAGGGDQITFQKKDGKWIKTGETHWVS